MVTACNESFPAVRVCNSYRHVPVRGEDRVPREPTFPTGAGLHSPPQELLPAHAAAHVQPAHLQTVPHQDMETVRAPLRPGHEDRTDFRRQGSSLTELYSLCAHRLLAP